MYTEQKIKSAFTKSITFKGLVIAIMTLAMLIPGAMVQDLILERKQMRDEAVQKIDAKWSYAQTVGSPILAIPYTQKTVDKENKSINTEHVFNIIPETLEIKTTLFPDERYYGIYKTILYKSISALTGEFPKLSDLTFPNGEMHWDKAYLKFGVSDLKGISNNITFEFNGMVYEMQGAGLQDDLMGEILIVSVDSITLDSIMKFNSEIDLKGSGCINFLPVAKSTSVIVEGEWPDPGFIGNYTPEYSLYENRFQANWKILHFNRNIPDTWTDNDIRTDIDISFGANLVDTIDIYRQNMRSAKYAILFIVLTFVTFFFVEIIGSKRIHPIQYLLVGIALILFYSLLLSISESLGFRLAYFISSIAIISMISVYAFTIFKNRKQAIALSCMLSAMYAFLYTIIQLENTALLAGSIGVFIILGIIMYFSRKINWYAEES